MFHLEMHSFALICVCFPLRTCVYIHLLRHVKISWSKNIILFSFVTTTTYGHEFVSTDDRNLKFPDRNHHFEFIWDCVPLQTSIYFYWWRDVKISNSKCLFVFICDCTSSRTCIYIHWWRIVKISRSKSILLSWFVTVFACIQVFISSDSEMFFQLEIHPFVFIYDCIPLRTCIYFHS